MSEQPPQVGDVDNGWIYTGHPAHEDGWTKLPADDYRSPDYNPADHPRERPRWFRRTWLWVLFAIVLGVGVGAAIGSDTPAPEPAGVTRTEPLYEDEPGWNCRTQGNRVCGTGH